MSREVKSVSFSLEDPFECKMYEYIESLPNFSGYVKRLIQNSMGGQGENIQSIKLAHDTFEQPIKQYENDHNYFQQLI